MISAVTGRAASRRDPSRRPGPGRTHSARRPALVLEPPPPAEPLVADTATARAASRAAPMKLTELAGILDAGRRFDPAGDVDPPRTQVLDGSADVLRAESTRDDEAAGIEDALGEPPVEELARAGVGAIDEEELGAILVERGRCSGGRPGMP